MSSLEKVSIILGYLGSIFLSLRFVPQIYKSYKRKNRNLALNNVLAIDTENQANSIDNLASKKVYEISMTFVVLEVLTCICFGFYGVFYKIWPMVIANCISFLGCLIVFNLECKN